MGEARLVERELVEHGLVPGRGLGDGSYGRVVRARRAEDGRGVAVKVLDHRKMTPRFLNQFLPRELLIHSGLCHPHVVRLFEHWEGAPGPHTYIVLELAENGDLEQHISRKGRMVDTGRAGDLPRNIFHQVLLAVQYLHNRGIAHRDIKCENVLLTASLVAKLGDFGFARHQTKGELSRTFCGSRAYAAPEVARQYPYSGQAADWWSLGVVLFIMLEARLPFDDRNVRAMLRAQTEQRVPFSQCPIGQPRFLILALLDPMANTRLSVTAALRHPWLLLSSIPDDLTQIPNDPEDDDDSDIP